MVVLSSAIIILNNSKVLDNFKNNHGAIDDDIKYIYSSNKYFIRVKFYIIRGLFFLLKKFLISINTPTKFGLLAEAKCHLFEHFLAEKEYKIQRQRCLNLQEAETDYILTPPLYYYHSNFCENLTLLSQD